MTDKEQELMPYNFEWTDEMYDAIDCIPKDPLDMNVEQLNIVYRALDQAKILRADRPAPLPKEREDLSMIHDTGVILRLDELLKFESMTEESSDHDLRALGLACLHRLPLIRAALSKPNDVDVEEFKREAKAFVFQRNRNRYTWIVIEEMIDHLNANGYLGGGECQELVEACRLGIEHLEWCVDNPLELAENKECEQDVAHNVLRQINKALHNKCFVCGGSSYVLEPPTEAKDCPKCNSKPPIKAAQTEKE